MNEYLLLGVLEAPFDFTAMTHKHSEKTMLYLLLYKDYTFIELLKILWPLTIRLMGTKHIKKKKDNFLF